jgi:hypothetical protein
MAEDLSCYFALEADTAQLHRRGNKYGRLRSEIILSVKLDNRFTCWKCRSLLARTGERIIIGVGYRSFHLNVYNLNEGLELYRSLSNLNRRTEKTT